MTKDNGTPALPRGAAQDLLYAPEAMIEGQGNMLPAPVAPQAPAFPVALQSLDDVLRLGDVLSKSGFFRDIRGAAQAVVKILAGAELGIGPIASMRSVHCFDGQTSLHYSLIAAMIKRSGRYDYRLSKLDDRECLIEFTERGHTIGFGRYTEEEAQAAGLLGKKNWKTARRDMLFARAMTRGARQFCPDVFNGPVYTPDELRDSAITEPAEEVPYEEASSIDEVEPAPALPEAAFEPAGFLPDPIAALQARLRAVGFRAKHAEVCRAFLSALLGTHLDRIGSVSHEGARRLLVVLNLIETHTKDLTGFASYVLAAGSEGPDVQYREGLDKALAAFKEARP